MGGRCYAPAPAARMTSTGARATLARFYVEVDIVKAWPTLIAALGESAGIPTLSMHNFLGFVDPSTPKLLDSWVD